MRDKSDFISASIMILGHPKFYNLILSGSRKISHIICHERRKNEALAWDIIQD
jgi:hypothetical protein